MSPSPQTLAFDAHQVWLTGFLLLFLVLTILVWGVLHLLSPRQHVALTKAVRRDWLNLLYVIAGVFFLAALGAAAAVLFDTIRNILHPPQMGSSSPNLGAGALIAALLGAPFVIWGTVLKHRTLGFQKEGHLTDRIAKAVEQIGAEKTVKHDGVERSEPNIEVRIGGLLSLERIAQDSVAYDNGRDHVRMMEIICAYIRNNAPARDLTETPLPFATKTPRLDIQKAIDVIKRRSDAQRALEAAVRYRLDLRNTDLDGCDLSNGHFEGAIFWRARLEAARLREADLTGAQFHGALLSYTDFYNTHLRGTHFKQATFTAGVRGPLEVATIDSLFIEGATMTGLHIMPENAQAIFGSRNTILDAEQSGEMQQALETAKKVFFAERSTKKQSSDRDEVLITDTDQLFLHWSPFDDSDIDFDRFRKRFIEKHGLTGWPFED